MKMGNKRFQAKSKSNKKRFKKSGSKVAPGLNSLGPMDSIPHVCDFAGRCCWSVGASAKSYSVSGTGLIPFDVWRMIVSPSQPLAKFGIYTTGQLIQENCFFGLTPDLHMPACGLKMKHYKGVDDSAKHCPFLVFDENKISEEQDKILKSGDLPIEKEFWFDGSSPTFSCGIEDAKPLQCESFPTGRYVSRLQNGRTRVHLVCSVDVCRDCMPSLVGKNIGPPVKDYLGHIGVKSHVDLTSQYLSVLDRLRKENTSDHVRLAVARTLFDFDSLILMQASENSTQEEILKMLFEKRPQSPNHLIQAAMAVMDGFAGKINLE